MYIYLYRRVLACYLFRSGEWLLANREESSSEYFAAVTDSMLVMADRILTVSSNQ